MKRLAIAVALSTQFVLPAFAQETAPPAEPATQPAPATPATPTTQQPAEPAAAQASGTPAAQQAQPSAAPQMSAEMQAMMQAWEKANTPGPQHKQLAEQFVGTWTTKQTMWMDPSAPPMTETGQVTSTLFGNRHVREDFKSQWMGQPFNGVGLTSYDNVRKKYLNSWVDDMSTGQFVSEGDYDPATRTYTFRGEMPDPMKPGTQIPTRTVVKVESNDRHVMEMYETRDGKEARTMQIEYTRAGP